MRRARRSALKLALAATLAGCAGLPRRVVAERAEALMRELVARNRFQGAVVIGRGDAVEYAAGFGFADLERRVPFTPDTPTDGASMAKTFTAAALLMLAAEGRIELETPVHQIVPAYPHAATRVRHLLAHAAGLHDYDWLDSRAEPGTPRSNASHLALLARDAPVPNFAPGSAFNYDNLAYDAAAMVIERISGLSYAQVIAERFARPLGLGAFVRPARFADWPGPRTRAFRRTPEGWKDHDAHDFEGFHGGANIVLSARDLQRWVAGYRRAVGAEAHRAALQPAQLDDGRSTGITLGSWYVAGDSLRHYYTGSHNGFFCFGYFDAARDISIGWVANDAPPSWLQPGLSRALISIAEGRAAEPPMAPPAADGTVDPAGTYRVPGVGVVTVQRDGPRLLLRHRDVAYQGFPVARGVHYVPGLDAMLRFAALPPSAAALSWDSVFAVAASIAPEAVPIR